MALYVWHFLPADGRVAHEGTLVIAGQTLKLPEDAKLALCKIGYHGSVRAIDALQYAPGPVVQRAVLGGTVLQASDKACASERTCVAVADASRVLWEFGCWCAERALNGERARGREPDQRSWGAVAAARARLRGEIDDAQLAAAGWAAADANAAAAATTAATTAGAARAAESEAQNTELEARLRELLGVTM